ECPQGRRSNGVVHDPGVGRKAVRAGRDAVAPRLVTAVPGLAALAAAVYDGDLGAAQRTAHEAAEQEPRVNGGVPAAHQALRAIDAEHLDNRPTAFLDALPEIQANDSEVG